MTNSQNNFLFFSRVSKEKKSIEVNRRPIQAVDKENEIDKRRKELAKQREAREKQIKEEVCKYNELKFKSFWLLSRSRISLRNNKSLLTNKEKQLYDEIENIIVYN
jgi:hypothetical protein